MTFKREGIPPDLTERTDPASMKMKVADMNQQDIAAELDEMEDQNDGFFEDLDGQIDAVRSSPTLELMKENLAKLRQVFYGKKGAYEKL